MTAFYNEIDPYAAAWLRNLIAVGLIADGVVDERSIEDINPEELRGFTQCHFFAGIGVWSLALRRAGWPDDRPVWTGSCPCQPFSTAGKGGGFADERHLWPAFHHLIRACQPPVVFGEQVASKDGRTWLALVHADLEGVGYSVGAADLCAAGVGAPHIRQRLYWVADSADAGPQRRWPIEAGDGGGAPRVEPERLRAVGGPRPADGHWREADWLLCRDGKWRSVESGAFPLAHGAPARVGRLRAYGNAIVAQCAEAFIRSADEAIRMMEMFS